MQPEPATRRCSVSSAHCFCACLTPGFPGAPSLPPSVRETLAFPPRFFPARLRVDGPFSDARPRPFYFLPPRLRKSPRSFCAAQRNSALNGFELGPLDGQLRLQLGKLGLCTRLSDFVFSACMKATYVARTPSAARPRFFPNHLSAPAGHANPFFRFRVQRGQPRAKFLFFGVAGIFCRLSASEVFARSDVSVRSSSSRSIFISSRAPCRALSSDWLGRRAAYSRPGRARSPRASLSQGSRAFAYSRRGWRVE